MLTPETLKAALELTSVPMLAVSADGRVVLLNSGFEELIGYKTEEIAGQPVEQLLPRTTRDRHGQFVQAFMKVPAKRKMGQGRTLMGLSKSGQEIPLELGLNIVDVDGVPMARAPKCGQPSPSRNTELSGTCTTSSSRHSTMRRKTEKPSPRVGRSSSGLTSVK